MLYITPLPSGSWPTHRLCVVAISLRCDEAIPREEHLISVQFSPEIQRVWTKAEFSSSVPKCGYEYLSKILGLPAHASNVSARVCNTNT